MMILIHYLFTGDPPSNLLLQHLQLSFKIINDSGSSAIQARINCFNEKLICDREDVLTYPILKLITSDGHTTIYDGLAHYQHISKSILL